MKTSIAIADLIRLREQPAASEPLGAADAVDAAFDALLEADELPHLPDAGLLKNASRLIGKGGRGDQTLDADEIAAAEQRAETRGAKKEVQSIVSVLRQQAMERELGGLLEQVRHEAESGGSIGGILAPVEKAYAWASDAGVDASKRIEEAHVRGLLNRYRGQISVGNSLDSGQLMELGWHAEKFGIDVKAEIAVLDKLSLTEAKLIQMNRCVDALEFNLARLYKGEVPYVSEPDWRMRHIDDELKNIAAAGGAPDAIAACQTRLDAVNAKWTAEKDSLLARAHALLEQPEPNGHAAYALVDRAGRSARALFYPHDDIDKAQKQLEELGYFHGA